MARRRTRIRGILSTLDANPAIALTLYEEGTRTVKTVGANDILQIDSYAMSVDGITSSTTVAKLYFSDNGTEDAGSTIAVLRAPTTVAEDHMALALPHPVSGIPGETVYGITENNGDPLSIVVTGWLYEAD